MAQKRFWFTDFLSMPGETKLVDIHSNPADNPRL